MEKQHQSGAIELRPLPNVERGRLLLGVPVESVAIPGVVESYAVQHGFKPKDEYHVTIVGKKTQERLLAQGALDEVVELIDDASDWRIISYDNVLLLRNVEVDSDGMQVVEEAIIQLVTLPAIETMYDRIREITSLDIPTPPAHVTLFTKNADRGIGLYSSTQLAEYTAAKLL